jgi:excinuclease UvrABC nuclease subunit
VYLFRDAAGRVLYVGKAKDLRTRVRSYFSGDGRVKVADLLRELATIDHHPCATELEASVREVRLIQHHRPRYNRRGRNPERYCYLKATFFLSRANRETLLPDDSHATLHPQRTRCHLVRQLQGRRKLLA